MTLKAQLAAYTTITTERLTLRPVTLADAADIYAYLRDEETVKFISVPPAKSIEDVIENSIKSYFMLNPLGKWGIEYAGKLVGTIDLRLDDNNRSAEIGYVLNQAYWGQGIMPEAANAIVQLGFEKLNLVRIHAEHDVLNPKSGRVMIKIGMQREGIALKSLIVKGIVSDTVQYAITDEMYANYKLM
ncbi:N-acetyltransferase [Periweissella cryptocerci]|uniref:N-acetyltransferase n=1 Tax=Periweissella cryptocerci TaxID=2506420 RepID=A0A4P6YRH1_9LACO|nr:GNAT family protein [Periweissella cryptocerci]QBO35220.1 N-acetyltransferase [Periweissella cryptocerci]